MGEAIIIAVSGDTPIDNIITRFTGGIYSHVAIQTNENVVEALGTKEDDDPYPGVWKHDLHKYDNDPNAKFFKVKVPNLGAGNKWLESVIGTPYAFPGCVVAAISIATGVSLPCDGELTMNCSETVARYLRECGLDFLSGEFADSITPFDDVEAIS